MLAAWKAAHAAKGPQNGHFTPAEADSDPGLLAVVLDKEVEKTGMILSFLHVQVFG